MCTIRSAASSPDRYCIDTDEFTHRHPNPNCAFWRSPGGAAAAAKLGNYSKRLAAGGRPNANDPVPLLETKDRGRKSDDYKAIGEKSAVVVVSMGPMSVQFDVIDFRYE